MIPGNIVKPSREFGKGPDVGRSKRYAREDHSHGTPDLNLLALIQDLIDSGDLSIVGGGTASGNSYFPSGW